MQDDKEAVKQCRIPQTCAHERTKFYRRPKPLVAFSQTSRLEKPKIDSKPTMHINRGGLRTLNEEHRPLSTRADKSEPDFLRKEILLPAITTKLSTFPSKALPSYMMSKNNTGKSVITVPLIQNKLVPHKMKTQEADKDIQIKQDWLQMSSVFEKNKSELIARQSNILELYDSMKATHKRMIALGHKVTLPEDLGLMTIPKPSQSLLLPTNEITVAKHENVPYEGEVIANLDRLYEIPLTLVDVCEKSLSHNKNITDWLKSVLASKEMKINNLVTKISDFNYDNELLEKLLQDVKTSYLKKVQNVINISRIEVNNITMKVQTKDNSCELSNLSGKQIKSKELCNKINSTTLKIRELEDNIQQEKHNKIILEGRCIHAESELETEVQKNLQLQSTLDKAILLTKTLEHRVQQFEDDMKNIQNTFQDEIKTLNESLNEKKQRILDITSSHDKLRLEKDDLENQFEKSRQYQNECLQNMKIEVDTNTNKYKIISEKYDISLQEKDVLETKVVSLAKQINDLETLNKELTEIIKQSEIELQNAEQDKVKLLEKIQDKCDILKENQVEINQLSKNVESLKNLIKSKEDYTEKLENQHSLLKQEILENEDKMETYELQLKKLKNKLYEFQQEFQQMPNFKDLQTTIYNQDSKLLEIRKEKIQLTESFQMEIDQKNAIIKDLLNKQHDSDKQKLSLENQIDKKIFENNILTNKIMEKEEEIQSLMKSVKDSKQQIYNLEKIVLALNEPTEKLKLQQRKDHEKILYLMKKLSDYKHILNQSKNTDIENMDKIFDTFESELNIKPYIVAKHSRNSTKLNNIEAFECHDNGSNSFHNRPTKIKSHSTKPKISERKCYALGDINKYS